MIRLCCALKRRWTIVFAACCLTVPLVGCGPIHWLMLPGACDVCGVPNCTLHLPAAQGQGQSGQTLNPPRPRFHPVPTRPVFTAGFTPARWPRDISNTYPQGDPNDTGAGVDRQSERSIEPREREDGDADSSNAGAGDAGAGDEEIPKNTARNRTAQRQPPREIDLPEMGRPMPAVESMRQDQGAAKKSGGLSWRRHNVGH